MIRGLAPSIRMLYSDKVRMLYSDKVNCEFIAIDNQGLLVALGHEQSEHVWGMSIIKCKKNIQTQFFIDIIKADLSFQREAVQNIHIVSECVCSFLRFELFESSPLRYFKSKQLRFYINETGSNRRFAFRMQNSSVREFVNRLTKSVDLTNSIFTSPYYKRALQYLRDLDFRHTPLIDPNRGLISLWGSDEAINCLKFFVDDFGKFNSFFEEFNRISSLDGDAYNKWISALRLSGSHVFRGVSIARQDTTLRITFAGQFFDTVFLDSLTQDTPRISVAFLLFYLSVIGKENQFYSMITRKALLK